MFNVTKNTRLNDIVSMSRDEKVGTCRRLGLDAKGNKEELVARLWAAIEPQVEALKAEALAAETAAEAARVAQAQADATNPRYVEVIEGLLKMVATEIESNQAVIAKFQETVQKDPVYAMEWQAENVMEAQATLNVLTPINAWLAKATTKTLQQMIDISVQMGEQQMRRVLRDDPSGRSTCAVSNLNTMAKFRAMQKEVMYHQHITKCLNMVNSDKPNPGIYAASFYTF